MNIVRINKDELATIRDLAKRTWPISYAEMISSDQIEYMLKLMYSEEELTKQMEAGHQFYILLKDGQPIGYIGVQIIASALFMHKLYILPEEQGNAYGLNLIDHAVDLAKKANCMSVRLNVNRDNKALSFYKRNGFNIIKELDIDIGGGYFMNDYQMELSLSL